MKQLRHICQPLGFGSFSGKAIRLVPLAYVRWLFENDVLEYTQPVHQLEFLKLVKKALAEPKGFHFSSLHDNVPFGQYQGKTLIWIALEQPDYFCWLVAEEVIRCTDRNFKAVLKMAKAATEREMDTIEYHGCGGVYSHTTTGRTTTRGFQPVFSRPRGPVYGVSDRVFGLDPLYAFDDLSLQDFGYEGDG